MYRSAYVTPGSLALRVKAGTETEQLPKNSFVGTVLDSSGKTVWYLTNGGFKSTILFGTCHLPWFLGSHLPSGVIQNWQNLRPRLIPVDNFAYEMLLPFQVSLEGGGFYTIRPGEEIFINDIWAVVIDGVHQLVVNFEHNNMFIDGTIDPLEFYDCYKIKN